MALVRYGALEGKEFRELYLIIC